MDGALADVRARLRAGERVYVHCWGGRGRAGTLGACALAALYGLPGDAALVRVQRAFDTRGDGGAHPCWLAPARRLSEVEAAAASVKWLCITRRGYEYLVEGRS